MQVTNLLHVSFSLVLGMRGGVEPRNLKWGTWNCVRMKTVTSICAIKGRDKPKHVGGVIQRTSESSSQKSGITRKTKQDAL